MNKRKPKKKSRSSNDLSNLLRIYNFMVHQDLGELDWEEKEFKIFIRRQFGSGASFRRHGKESRNRVLEREVPALADRMEENTVTINSPIVGVFYTSLSPGASPFVAEGDIISPGETVCIIEAMKLMNEIQAETKCKIIKVLASNAQSVQVNDPLFLVAPIED